MYEACRLVKGCYEEDEPSSIARIIMQINLQKLGGTAAEISTALGRTNLWAVSAIFTDKAGAAGSTTTFEARPSATN